MGGDSVKLLTWVSIFSLALVIGSAGALEMATIGLGQALIQMGVGTFGFWASARGLLK